MSEASPTVAPAATYQVRPAWAEVDLGAIRHNAGLLSRLAAPALLCAVVKADGYGHGAVEVSRAALAGGATWLAVALVEEGRELRAAGIAAPVLILSEPPPEAMTEVVAAGLTPTIYTRAGLLSLTRAVATGSPERDRPFPVHVKVDTGMHRVGAAPDEAVSLATAVAQDPLLELDGFWTHLAVSDETENPFTSVQVERYEATLDRLAAAGVRPRLRHVANSAGTLWHDARFDMVRCGIALYGLSPDDSGPPVEGLIPALSIKARVSYAKPVAASERLSYGLRYELVGDSVVATVPLGYADGVPRMLSANGGEVLLDGRRCPIAGTVTMDQILVDCGAGSRVSERDEVVLIGAQGDERIGAWEWARASGTIAYEIVCGISKRVPRVYVDGSLRPART